MNEPVDFKTRYNELVTLTDELFELNFKVGLIRQKIKNHVLETDRLDQQSRSVKRLMKLKADCKIMVRWDQTYPGPERVFIAGTLIECDESGVVYLDCDGDGFLDFPPELLDPVEIPNDQLLGDDIIWQG